MKTSTESDTYITSLIENLREDARRVAAGEPVGDSGVRAPRRGGAQDKATGIARKISKELFPSNDADQTTSNIRYGQLISKLRRAYLQQSQESRSSIKDDNPFRKARLPGNRQLFEQLLSSAVSETVLHPTPMPVDIAPQSDLVPVFDYVQSGQETSHPCLEFQRGALYDDGRIDMCKQVVGSPYIGELTKAIEQNPSIRHFLIGNNVVGNRGAGEIAKLVSQRSADSPIETLYLAGNRFDADGIALLAESLKNDPFVKSLWLKRNPIGPEGILHIARMLEENDALETLDLVNTAVGDEGAAILFDSLKRNKSLRTLYLDANAITPIGCRCIANYFEFLKSEDREGLTGLFVGINRIGDAGANSIAEAIASYQPMARLDVGGNRIQNTGLSALLEATSELRDLVFLGLGLYKSTSDLGELPNYFDGEGIDLVQNYIRENHPVKMLDLKDTNLREDGWEGLAGSLEQNTNLVDLNCAQLGFKLPSDLQKKIDAVLGRNVLSSFGLSLEEFRKEKRRSLKHTDRIRFIDSIYRNTM